MAASKRMQSSASAVDGAYCSLEQLVALRWQAANLTLPKARRASRPQSGAHRSRFRGRGMEFAEVRVYQPGDDIRSIDWRVTARRQIPHTKLFNEERERPVMILVDQSRSQFFGSRLAFKSVRAAQAAALFAWTALAHNDRVGGIVFSEQGHSEIRPARSRKNLLRFLQDVTEFNHALTATPTNGVGEFSLNAALNEAVRLIKPGTLVVLISDFLQLNADSEALVSKLARHNELLFVQTHDELEQHLPPAGRYPVSSGDTTLILDTRSKEAAARYQQWALQREQFVSDLASKYRCPRIPVPTHTEAVNALHSVLVSVGR